MDCLTSLINLDGTCNGGGAGILSLQDIGITEGLIAKVVNEDETPAILLSRVNNLAANVVRNDVVTFFANRIIPRTMVDGEGFGHPDEDAELLSGAVGQIGGIVVELGAAKSNQQLTISMLGIYTDASAPVTYVIYDLTDGTAVAAGTIVAVADEVTRQTVNITLPASKRRARYFIATDLLSYYKVDILGNGDCGSCAYRGRMVGGVNVWAGRVAASLPVRYPNVQSASHTSGLVATITVGCDHAALLCEVKDRMALPMLYKVGQLITERAIYAFDRLNSQTIDKDALRERHDNLGKQYAAAMDNILSRMSTPDDPICFICNGKTRTFTAIP